MYSEASIETKYFKKMSYFSVQFIKTLNKHELKLEIINRGFDVQGKKVDLWYRLTKAISETPNDA